MATPIDGGLPSKSRAATAQPVTALDVPNGISTIGAEPVPCLA